MDTLSFLQKTLPSQGLYVLAAFRRGMDFGPSHSVYESLEDLAVAAQHLDRRGIPVFHACATFAERRKKTKVFDGKEVQVEATRAADNTAYIRSQWLDLDVGESKDYPDRKTALAALASMCRSLSIPAPMVVSSGRGFHCYWPFTSDIPAKQAGVLTRTFGAAMKAVQFKHDTTRTADLASILRPVGTHWRKEGVVQVELLRDAAPISPKQFMAALLKHTPPLIKAAVSEPVVDEWSTGPKEYPPSSALQIIKFCPTMAHVAEQKGNVAEPLWRAMLGVVKHTVEGDALAHEWSKGHPDYTADQTQEKYDAWSAGPTACTTFASQCDLCNGCKHAEKRSPIHLGYSEDTPSISEPEPAAAADYAPEAAPREVRKLTSPDDFRAKYPDNLPFWPKHYRWDGEVLSRAMKDEDGAVSWVPFCNTLFYPYLRFWQEDGTWAARLCVRVEKGRWRDAEIQAKVIAENQALATALGAFEIFSLGKQGKEHMKQFMQDFLRSMKEHRIETVTYNAFGWHDSGFVVGDTKITLAGDEPVLLGTRVPDTAKTAFGISGSSNDWADLIDTIYNRPGAEPYQFLICAAFGAPLVKLVASDMWHGIPIALTGDSGLGKTTTCKVACSIYGDPRHFAISTNQEGSTMNALIQRVALMRNLPIVLDEMTGRSTVEIQGMLFALSNGKPKERSRSDGSLIGADLTWDTISFVTGNMNITNMLSELDRQKATATQLRCFEIMLPPDYNREVFAGVNAKELIEGELLSKQYGSVGREYLRYVLQHKAKITERLQKMRAKYNPVTQDETRERFYYDLMVTALMGGMIARQLGMLRFDLDGVRKWAEEHIKTLRGSRRASAYSPEDYLQELLSYLHDKTVETRWFRDARVHKDKASEIIDTSRLRNPVARIATEDRKFFITVKAFNTWCAEIHISGSWFVDELDKRGYIIKSPTGTNSAIRIFRGTNVNGPTARVIELDYDKVTNFDSRPTHLKAVESVKAVV